MSLDVHISEPDEFNCSELHGCIENVARIKHINNFTYHVEFVSGKGENYIANVFRVTIKDSESNDNSVSVIVKTLVNTIRQELFHELHKREVIAYTKIISKYKELQDNLIVEDRIVLPECVLSIAQKGNEVLILEDLLSNGFEFDSKFIKLDNLRYSEVCTIVTALAKFHALSFVYEEKDAEGFSKVKSEFQDLIFQESFINKSRLKTFYTDSYEMSLNLVKDLEARSKLQNIKCNLMEILREYIRPRKCNVLCHGDFWINNFLFKHEDAHKSDICFLDFQAMRYANPVTDIIYFLYLCTDSQYRSEYFFSVFKVYYDSLSSFLKLFKIDAGVVYPKEDFEADITEMLPFGLIIALIELRIVTVTPEEVINMENTQNCQTESNEYISNAFIDNISPISLVARVNDVVNESIRNGILDKLYEQLSSCK